jgi:hypothetical protein
MDRIDHDGNRKLRWNRGTILEGHESEKEKKRSKRESGDEIKKGPRIIYHKDENEPSYSRRRANRRRMTQDVTIKRKLMIATAFLPQRLLLTL